CLGLDPNLAGLCSNGSGTGTPNTFAYPPDNTEVPPKGPGGNGSDFTSTHSVGGVATMYNGVIDNMALDGHDNAPCPTGNCADDYAVWTLTFHVTSSPANVMLLIGGHTAVGTDPTI